MEYGIIFAGLLVVAGLVMESGPELRMAWIEWRLPKLSVTGGVIVTVGVFVEVVLGIFITQRANRAQSDANERIAQVNLERTKLDKEFRRRSVSRLLSDDERADFIKALSPHAGQTFSIQVELHSIEKPLERRGEQLAFADQISAMLISSGWIRDESPLPEHLTAVKEGLALFVELLADNSRECTQNSLSAIASQFMRIKIPAQVGYLMGTGERIIVAVGTL